MALLIAFAFLAGAATIFAPCILPILPAVLAGGATGGKRRPLGVAAGLVISFTFFTLSISYLVRKLGLGPDVLRDVAIGVLLLFGIVLLVPSLLIKIEVWLSSRIPAAADGGGDGFWSGTLLGASLGLVWTPCVGPIVASVITLAATSSVTFASVLITVAYAVGTSLPLLGIMYGGQGLLKRIRGAAKYTGRIQQAFGFIMIGTALSMYTGLDRTVQAALLSKLPSGISTGLTQKFERSAAVQERLQGLKGDGPAPFTTTGNFSSGLPVLGRAPELTGITGWINSNPLTLDGLRGKVVLVDFWTYSCINCIRTLPHLTAWDAAYRDQGLVVLGVHAPEFAFEKVAENVRKAAAQYGITYPIALDNDFGTWNAYGNQYWPAHYLIDAQGLVRQTHSGEGGYEETETAIRSLLQEARVGAKLPGATRVDASRPAASVTPETYLGTDRADRFAPGAQPAALQPDSWTLGGNWEREGQRIVSEAGSTVSFKFTAQEVYLVLNPPFGKRGEIEVTVDGVPGGGRTDTVGGIITADTDRLYHVAHTDGGTHLLQLKFRQAGVAAFAFTFG